MGKIPMGFSLEIELLHIYPEDIVMVVRLRRGTKGSRKYTAEWHASFLSCVVHFFLEIGLGKAGMEL